MERTVALRDLDEERFLFGHLDRNLHVLRHALGVEATSRRGQLKLKGPPASLDHAARTVEHALALIREGRVSDPGAVERLFRAASRGEVPNGAPAEGHAPRSGGGHDAGHDKVHVAPRGRTQAHYLDAIGQSTVTFAIGPAGTGKSYLAVASAVRLLKGGQFRKIVLCRPAVEAGESLGFLPGDLQAKINPYLRPLYDALNELLPRGQLKRYIEEEIIEILPLAYMRGRTLDHAVIILDEAQNATIGQMKMFLTRLGERSKMIVTGDVTQVDLPAYKTSGLIHACNILEGIEGMSFIRFTKADIVRHPVVQEILKAYTKDEEGPGGGEEGGPEAPHHRDEESEPGRLGLGKRFRQRDARFRPR